MASATKPKKTEKNDETAERPSHKTDADTVRVGDIMAITDFVKVTKIDRVGPNMKMEVSTVCDGTDSYSIQGRVLVENAKSADRYVEEMKVTKTRAAELLVTSHNRPFTVCFVKEGKPDEGPSERTLRGRLVHAEPLLGRSKVEDLDIAKGEHRLRLVDHRTIIFLIVDGVKYTVK